MTEPTMSSVSERDLVVARTLAVHLAPPKLRQRLVSAEPLYMLFGEGRRMTGQAEAVGLVADGTQLGLLMGMIETRVGGRLSAPDFAAARARGAQVARAGPEHSIYLPPAPSAADIVEAVRRNKTAAAGIARALAGRIADGERDSGIVSTYAPIADEAEARPAWAATLTVAALLLLAERDGQR